MTECIKQNERTKKKVFEKSLCEKTAARLEVIAGIYSNRTSMRWKQKNLFDNKMSSECHGTGCLVSSLIHTQKPKIGFDILGGCIVSHYYADCSGSAVAWHSNFESAIDAEETGYVLNGKWCYSYMNNYIMDRMNEPKSGGMNQPIGGAFHQWVTYNQKVFTSATQACDFSQYSCWNLVNFLLFLNFSK